MAERIPPYIVRLETKIDRISLSLFGNGNPQGSITWRLNEVEEELRPIEKGKKLSLTIRDLLAMKSRALWFIGTLWMIGQAVIIYLLTHPQAVPKP